MQREGVKTRLKKMQQQLQLAKASKCLLCHKNYEGICSQSGFKALWRPCSVHVLQTGSVQAGHQQNSDTVCAGPLEDFDEGQSRPSLLLRVEIRTLGGCSRQWSRTTSGVSEDGSITWCSLLTVSHPLTDR